MWIFRKNCIGCILALLRNVTKIYGANLWKFNSVVLSSTVVKSEWMRIVWMWCFESLAVFCSNQLVLYVLASIMNYSEIIFYNQYFKIKSCYKSEISLVLAQCSNFHTYSCQYKQVSPTLHTRKPFSRKPTTRLPTDACATREGS